ncbi:signal peptidase I family protein [Coprinopsis cinerea AmutBmut pab1-1]|nr:signal peptidase I family protein [Coprinopsis cinerea AmutBmut pab1-1]
MQRISWPKFVAQVTFWSRYEIPQSLRSAIRVLYWSPLAIGLSSRIFEFQIVSGRSMQPTLNPDWSSSRDVALFDRTAAWDEQVLDREDIVVLKSPMDPNYKLIKRIVAIEGDIVQTLPPYPIKEVVVPKGHVWVEGDDYYNSDDSNTFGPVARGLIESKLLAIVWPLERFGTIKKPEIPEIRAGPAFRRAMVAFDRERARQARVKTFGPGPLESPSPSS